jgi:hypothetical protein
MPQEPKDRAEVEAIVGRVRYEEKRFRVGLMGDGYFVQIEYDEPDIRTNEMALQRGRKWYVSPYATESEIVQTCLAAVLASAEHQAREHFGYAPAEGERPKAIFAPHYAADALYGIAGNPESYDARADPE